MNTEDKLRELLVPILGATSVDSIRPEHALVRDLGAESIDFVEILYVIETQFGVSIRIQEITLTDYSSEEALRDGKMTQEIADKLNKDFNTTRFSPGQTIKDVFETFTVRDMATIIDKKKNAS
jgi:acyl carrier protein